ncbi:hypothetical protein ElyMa_004472300 [Elysia marginata]|uniref:Receptor ligand binding region domain-containing protein n=1 Tax=Elysia marginata TaxID=1093978 RepID=A0AAV4HG34_9GAST|nr:hypothetical protein ElyMa_004472300 [Elysia marginata]
MDQGRPGTNIASNTKEKVEVDCPHSKKADIKHHTPCRKIEPSNCASYNLTSESAARCHLAGSNVYSGYLTSAVDAVYLLANALKTMHNNLCPGHIGVCDDLRVELEKGMLYSHNLTQVDYARLDPSHVPPEFVSTGRALVPDGGDFLVRSQSLYDLKANQGDSFVSVSFTRCGLM